MAKKRLLVYFGPPKKRGRKPGQKDTAPREPRWTAEVGKKSGLLTVTGYGYRTLRSNGVSYVYMVDCACLCGNKINVDYANILNGNARSCGCLSRLDASEAVKLLLKYATQQELDAVWRGR